MAGSKRRRASSEEVARWLLIVADPSVIWLTGQVIGVDDGMSVT
jgi:NAD(P)-dependent dehydrogenase (short-subunit alcohol dehydrogenase family)